MAGIDASEAATSLRAAGPSGSDSVGDFGSAIGATDATATKPPLYWRILRLRELHPNGWQRASLVEGVIGISAILVLADVASAWTLLVLPVTSAVVVKAHDVLAKMLSGRHDPEDDPPV